MIASVSVLNAKTAADHTVTAADLTASAETEKTLKADRGDRTSLIEIQDTEAEDHLTHQETVQAIKAAVTATARAAVRAVQEIMS